MSEMIAEVPEYVDAEGFISVYFLPAAADLSAITVAEFAAGVDLGWYLPAAWEGMPGEQARTQQSRMALQESFEVLGRVTRSLAEFRYTYLPQADLTDPGNKVRSMMAQGSRGVIVARYGLNAETVAVAADQNYDAIRVVTGIQNKLTTPAEEGGPLTMSQSVSSQGSLVEGTVAAA